ncbi:MAG: MBL fold metallo-hydrolase [Pseudomonadales bacterium]|nr:MBL fold metallo-hydrolase [Pseudomonadales bacterium]
MRSLYPDLWQSRAEHPAPGLITHAYLLTREQGNVLLYNTSHADELDHMASLGGVDYQWLSHQDEVGGNLQTLQQRFGCELAIHRAEQAQAQQHAPVTAPFTDQAEERLGIRILPTPGHTRGSVCFFYTSPHGKRYLFTGDTILMDNEGRWRSGYLPGMSDKRTLAASLESLAALTPDVVISSATYGRHPGGGATGLAGGRGAGAGGSALV